VDWSGGDIATSGNFEKKPYAKTAALRNSDLHG